MFLRRVLAALMVLAVVVAVVAVVRRQRLDAATADFEQRYGPA